MGQGKSEGRKDKARFLSEFQLGLCRKDAEDTYTRKGHTLTDLYTKNTHIYTHTLKVESKSAKTFENKRGLGFRGTPKSLLL